MARLGSPRGREGVFHVAGGHGPVGFRDEEVTAPAVRTDMFFGLGEGCRRGGASCPPGRSSRVIRYRYVSDERIGNIKP